ncbi:hypothetical protein NP233_g10685 [Leucocoprinus birnbaumii]|uniref:Methyltransferase domain-containing protein n=1 Tax=Leucocoprinus birnbaumii TaxID=56174 RepID=A0AAD5VLI3_9AGAR|nr:hypothetical protein NP233_g10685 [Leucocoprinus birnbaumii]
MSTIPSTTETSQPSNLYKLPNDLPESQRLNLQHLIWTKLIHGLYPADLSKAVEKRLNSNVHSEVLDVGCGTGIWAIEMCKRFPTVKVTGLDITDWNRGNSTLPQNYMFAQCDLSKGLPGDFLDRFDIIQCRAVLQHMREPQKLVENMARCLKPGGILLLADGELSQGSFHRSRERVQPFIYDTTLTPEQNTRIADENSELSWLAGWLRGFGLGLESPEYQRPDKLARKSRLLTDVKLRDIWKDVSLSENGTYRGIDQDVKELISVNYVKAFDAVRSVLARQGVPESFVRDVWEPKILKTLHRASLSTMSTPAANLSPPHDDPLDEPPPYTPRADANQGESTVEFGPRRPFQQAPAPRPAPTPQSIPPTSYLSPQPTGSSRRGRSLWQQLSEQIDQFAEELERRGTGINRRMTPQATGGTWSSYPGQANAPTAPPTQRRVPPLPPRRRTGSTSSLPGASTDFARDFYTSGTGEGLLNDAEAGSSASRARSTRQAAAPPPQADRTPTTTPTAGRPLLREGKLLVYPKGHNCEKCFNTGYKGFDPSRPCKKCWSKFAKPFSGPLAYSYTSSDTLSNTQNINLQKPLPDLRQSPNRPPAMYSSPPPRPTSYNGWRTVSQNGPNSRGPVNWRRAGLEKRDAALVVQDASGRILGQQIVNANDGFADMYFPEYFDRFAKLLLVDVNTNAILAEGDGVSIDCPKPDANSNGLLDSNPLGLASSIDGELTGTARGDFGGFRGNGNAGIFSIGALDGGNRRPSGGADPSGSSIGGGIFTGGSASGEGSLNVKAGDDGDNDGISTFPHDRGDGARGTPTGSGETSSSSGRGSGRGDATGNGSVDGGPTPTSDPGTNLGGGNDGGGDGRSPSDNARGDGVGSSANGRGTGRGDGSTSTDRGNDGVDGTTASGIGRTDASTTSTNGRGTGRGNGITSSRGSGGGGRGDAMASDSDRGSTAGGGRASGNGSGSTTSTGLGTGQGNGTGTPSSGRGGRDDGTTTPSSGRGSSLGDGNTISGPGRGEGSTSSPSGRGDGRSDGTITTDAGRGGGSSTSSTNGLGNGPTSTTTALNGFDTSSTVPSGVRGVASARLNAIAAHATANAVPSSI